VCLTEFLTQVSDLTPKLPTLLKETAEPEAILLHGLKKAGVPDPDRRLRRNRPQASQIWGFGRRVRRKQGGIQTQDAKCFVLVHQWNRQDTLKMRSMHSIWIEPPSFMLHTRNEEGLSIMKDRADDRAAAQ
jgi:hypothetical protein